MSYPPPLPPDTRENDTPMADNHAGDHNAVVNALEDIVGVIGGFPQGAYTSSIQDRLSWLEWRPGVNLKFTVPVSPDKIVLRCGAVDAVVVNNTGATFGVTITAQAITATSLAASGAVTAASATVSGQINTATAVASGRITAREFNATVGPYFIGAAAHTLADAGGGVVRLQSAGGIAELRISGNSFAQITSSSFNVSPTVHGVNWNERPLVIYGSNLAAIGFSSPGIARYGAVQLYVSAVATAGFHFVNASNSAYLSCHAYRFVETSPPGMLRAGTEWGGNGLNICRRLRPQVIRAVVDTEGGPPIEGRPSLGFLPAHVAELAPELVEADDNNQPVGLAISGFLPILVDAIRRLDRRLDRLERELEVEAP